MRVQVESFRRPNRKESHGPAQCILSQSRLSGNRAHRPRQHQHPLALSRALPLRCLPKDFRCPQRHPFKGTPLYRRGTPEATIVLVLTLVAHGCPIAAIEAAFGLQRRTVQGWVEAAGEHCEQIHEHLVLKARCLAHVQADELRVKAQGSIVWLAMAIMVPTRLWLGASHKS